MVLLLFAYYLTFTTNLSADVYGISAMHGYKPVELFLLAFHNFERLTDRLEAIAGQMTNVFTHGGREND